MEEVDDDGCDDTEKETPPEGAVNSILEQTRRTNSPVLDSLVQVHPWGLTGPLTQRISLGPVEVGPFGVNDPADDGIVDGNSDECAPDLGEECGAGADFHVVADLLVKENTLGAVPALAGDDTVNERADWVGSWGHVSVTVVVVGRKWLEEKAHVT